jgi:hypothetical protein
MTGVSDGLANAVSVLETKCGRHSGDAPPFNLAAIAHLLYPGLLLSNSATRQRLHVFPDSVGFLSWARNGVVRMAEIRFVIVA